MALLKSTWLATVFYHSPTLLYLTLLPLRWLYYTLLDSTLLFHAYTSLYLNLQHSTIALLHSIDSTLLYHGPTSQYLTLHHSIYNGSTSLYWLCVMLPCTLLDSTAFYSSPTSFHLTLHYPTLALLDSKLLIHASTSFYLTLLHSTMALLHSTIGSTLLYHDFTSLCLLPWRPAFFEHISKWNSSLLCHNCPTHLSHSHTLKS